MKIRKATKREILKIANGFDLGVLNSYKLIKGGLVNHNYLVETQKGDYIIRIMGDGSPKKLKHLKLQFRIFDYLKRNKFPYLLPHPLKTKDSKAILNIGSKKIWVYEMIEGKNYDRPNIPQIRLMARALAVYHQFISGFKGEKQKDESEKRIIKGFEKMQKITVHNAADRLALKYRDYFKDVFNSVRKIKSTQKLLFVHGDFDSSNVLFSKGKLIGIIDFDETFYSPRIFDVSISIRDSCYTTSGKFDIKKVNLFLREYEKVSKLSKEEKDMIIPIILKANVDFFVWAYIEMKKEKENKGKYMREMINSTENIIKNKEKIQEAIMK